MADLRISDLVTASQLKNDDYYEISQSESGTRVSYKATLLAIAVQIATMVDFTSDLNTTSKKITGAINELKNLISLIPQFSIEVVQVLPTEDISDTTIYLVPAEDPEVGNYYEEYIHVNNTWELVGTTAVDLSGYYTKVESDGKFAVTISNTISPTTTTKKVADIKQNNVTTPVYADDADKILRAAFGEHTVSGNPVSVDAFLGLEVPSECKVTMLPIQDLSHGDPSPTNICPISGRDSVTVFHPQESFYNNDNLQAMSNSSAVALSDNSIQVTSTANGTYRSSKQLLSNYSLTEGKRYRISSHYSVNKGTAGIAIRNSSNSRIAYTDYVTGEGNLVLEFVLTSEMNYLSFFCTGTSSSAGDVTYSDIKFSEVEEHTHTYSSTVYGGVDDFVSGEGSSNMDLVDMGTLLWRKGNQYFYSTSLSPVIVKNTPIYCDIFKSAITGDGRISNDANGNLIVVASVYDDLSEADFKTAMSGHQLCYELSTPTSITNTPEDISLLKGVNVLSTDGDSLELKYSADIKAYIDSKLA